MVDKSPVDPNADEPKGEEVPVDSKEFDDAWAEFEQKEKASTDEVPPDPEADKLGDDEAKPQPANEERPADAPPEAKPASASDEPTDDPWAAHPELKAIFDREIGERDNTIRRHSGRLSRVTHDLNTLRAQIESQRDSEGATQKGDEATDPEERRKQLREEYPEVAGPILDMIQSLEGQVRSLSEKEVGRTEAQVSELIDEQERYVTERHGDLFNEIRGDKRDTFLAWMGQQPKGIQDMIERNGSAIIDAAEVNLVLDLFQQSQGGGTEQRNELDERRRRQLEGGRTPATKQPGASPGSKAEDDFSKAWDEFEAKDRARAAGRR